MRLVQWLTGCFSSRGKAVSLYKRGMEKAKSHDHAGALEDYTSVIGLPGAPTELLAMALYNRALVYVAVGDNRNGLADLGAVLTMKDPLVCVKLRARQKLVRIESRAGKSKL